MPDLINPYNNQNPFLQTMQSKTGSGRVAQQNDRDIKKVGDLAKTQGTAQRMGMSQALADKARQRIEAERASVEDIEYAKGEAKKDVEQYANILKEQWNKLIQQMNKERETIAKDMYGQQESAAMQQRFAALGSLAQAGITAASAFIPQVLDGRTPTAPNLTTEEKIKFISDQSSMANAPTSNSFSDIAQTAPNLSFREKREFMNTGFYASVPSFGKLFNFLGDGYSQSDFDASASGEFRFGNMNRFPQGGY